MITHSENWTLDEWGEVEEALIKYHKLSQTSDSPYFHMSNPQEAYTALRSRTTPAFRCGQFLMVYTVSKSWCNSDKRVFAEMLLLSAFSGPRITLDAFEAHAEGLAKQLGCVAMTCGNPTFGRPALTKARNRQGYRQINIELFKDIYG